MMTKKLAWFIFFAVLAVSCLDDPDCFNLNNNVVGIAFRTLYDGKTDTVTFVSVTATGTDSILASYTQATGLQVPLNYLTDETTITFEMLDRDGTFRTTTMAFGYTAQAQFVSEECGERFVVSNLNLLNTPGFDSVRFLSRTPSPTNSSSANMIVYRCPSPNLIQFGFRQWNATNDEADSLGDAMPRGVSGITAGYTGTVFYNGVSTRAVKLPANPSELTTTYNFTFTDGTSNSVTVNYEKSTETLLFACGEQALLHTLTASGDFDGVEIMADSVQDPPVTNVALLKCPVTHIMKVAFVDAEDAAATVTINKITAPHMADIIINAGVSSVELPLDVTADASNFVIEFADASTKNLDVQYTRTPFVYHEVCDQTVITDLDVTAHGFTTEPEEVDTSVQFPTVTNIEIVND